MGELTHQRRQQRTDQQTQDSGRRRGTVLQDNRAAAEPVAQRTAASPGGLPEQLKSGIESLSGMSMDHVRVHYSSPKPAQLNAHAYAQGNEIHMAPGQSHHLPHEAWHVVQQAQGRVRPTAQMGGTSVNDEHGLEAEADSMGARAAALPVQRREAGAVLRDASAPTGSTDGPLQGKFFRMISVPVQQPGILPVQQPETVPVQQPEIEPVQQPGTVPVQQPETVPVQQPETVPEHGTVHAPQVGPLIPQTSLMPVYASPDSIFNEAVKAGFLQKMPKEQLKDGVKKLAEGPDIFIRHPSEFSGILNYFLSSHEKFLFAEKGTAPAAWRKVNRLAGLMQTKMGMLNWPKGMHPSILQGMDFLMGQMISLVATHQFEHSTHLLQAGIDLLKAVKSHLAQTGSRYMWRIYDVLGQLGPLAHALSGATDGNKEVVSKNEIILVQLREIRQLMAMNPDGATVVAHRGAGPTNRTMGGLIQDDDNRRTNRPAENSPEAFASAFQSAGPGALDGIECDVFLSHDDVAMLSHEGKVREQLSNVQKGLYKGIKEHHHIHNLDSGQLEKIQRTASKGSRFMSLWELLCSTVPVAHDFYESTGKAFRVEVEMKGAKHNPALVEKVVAKTVSKFHKTYTGLPIEIILFNGDADQVEGYAKKRNTKTALGALYTGLGVKTEQLNAGGFDKRYIDELRYQFTSEFSAKTVDKSDLKFASRYLDEFIATLVFGQELAEHDVVPPDQQPSKPLMYGRDEDDRPLDRTFDKKIQAALERFASNPNNLQKIKKLHVLTDYPRKAKWMKEGLAKASAQALKAISKESL